MAKQLDYECNQDGLPAEQEDYLKERLPHQDEKRRRIPLHLISSIENLDDPHGITKAIDQMLMLVFIAIELIDNVSRVSNESPFSSCSKAVHP